MIHNWRYKDIIRVPLGAIAFTAMGYFLLENYNTCDFSDKSFDQLLLWGTAGVVISGLSYKYVEGKKANYLSTLALRLILGFTLFYTVYFHFWYEPIPDINLVAINDTNFKDITPYELKSLINKMSTSLKTLEAYLALISLVLLVNRRTASLGFIIMVPTYAYMLASNIDTSCDMFATKALLSFCLAGTLPDMFNIIKFWTEDQPIKRTIHPFFAKSHLYSITTLLKYFILTGLFVMFINKPNKYKQYYANNLESPIKGVWTIKDVSLNKKTDNDFQSDSLFQAKKIYLSSSRYGKIRMNDTLSTFEYMVDPSNNQFELWNFLDYRKLDLKGKFEYLSDDTVRFKGRNAKDEISFTMVLEDGIKVD